MNNPHFIVNKDKIKEKRKSLTQTSVEDDGWEIHYVDQYTNEEWIEYQMEPEYHGGEYPMLVKQPLPKTNDLIEIALGSNSLDEIAGVSVFIFTNEQYDKTEFRDKLIDAIEGFYEKENGELTEFDTKKLETVIYETSLSDSTNRKPIMGKHYTEIEQDHKYYLEIAGRAKKILNQIKR